MCTPSATAKYTEDKPRLAAPSFLTGGVAAFVAEGELSQRNLSAAILVKEGISACYNDIKALRNTALTFAGGENEEDIVISEGEFEASVRKLLKSERANGSAMYM